MSTIKFRGQILDGPRKGEWVYGYYYVNTLGMHNIVQENGQTSEVDPKTVGQYIWIKDKNEKESHIGDICKSFFGDNIGVIEWHKTNPWIVLRYVDSRNGMYSFDHLSLEAFEIIGDIHSNPDLLTQ